MDNLNKDPLEEPFSQDPEENLRIENELLKLKLEAERGAFFSGFNERIPAEIENNFLKGIQQFEESWEQATQTTLYELIGKPDWKKVSEMDPDELPAALENLMGLLKAGKIDLYLEGEYPPAVIYTFITEEFFGQEVVPITAPGFMMGFVYEEFHPNHALLIEKTAKDFLDDWFGKKFTDYSFELGDRFFTAENRQYTREEVLGKLRDCLDSYLSFSDPLFTNMVTSFEGKDPGNPGLGFAEGMISYEARLENGEIIKIGGPYKFEMSYESVYWQIFNFVFPGFSW